MLITCVLCWFLYKRSNWARVVTGLLSLLGVLVGVAFLAKPTVSIDDNVILVIMVIFYAFAAYVLLRRKFVGPAMAGTDT